MKLFFTDATYKVAGQARPKVPFLCDKNMELVETPNQYLRYIATVKGRTRSPNTWRAYSFAIFEFFAFLEANSLAWEKVNSVQLAAWRDAMIERGCATSTVNQRVRAVSAFYGWAVASSLVHSLPFSKEEVWVPKSKEFLAHINASGGRFEANELTLRTHKSLPMFLHLDQAKVFLDALSPHRLRLMGYLMLLTGMRREEVVGFDYRVLPNPSGRDPTKQIPIHLDPSLIPTKGRKDRTIMLPYDLAVALYDYFTFIWPKLLNKHKRLYRRETTLLFLAESGAPLSLTGVNNAFAKASTKTGIKCHPHMLRHTFGTYELLRMSRARTQSQAILWVRDRMGHSSITTTEQYVHASDLVQYDDVDGYQAELCEALRYGN
ncbi:tyrosine-type recombinase/integrase [Burkholderia anthina]|uniref:tyrosine-type recombinase/integrase n=1 Tax=Burkholderia anthina TaxID=179879 RepID=UPI00158E4229|nr:tyrosine-type recombinase/integrase [Burkholderia anthina]